MIHQMRFNHNTFIQFSSGRKTAEIRLYDEKRRKIQLGDEIHFTDRETAEVLETKVIGLSLAPTFIQLFSFVDPLLACYEMNTTPEFAAKDMSKYYSETDELTFGVVAIHVQLL